MKKKNDIFNGKVKKEYYSYILGYMIFFFLLFVALGVLFIYGCVCCMTTNTLGERLLIAALGGIAFLIAIVYVFLELLVVRNFPKYFKLRRALFNSDIYFTDSVSTEYLGSVRTVRRRWNKAAFDLVTFFAEAEKGMGDKKPVQYKIYSFLVSLMAGVELVILFAVPILFENGVILSSMSDGVFVLCFLLLCIICLALTIFFLVRLYNAALMAPLEKYKWKSDLYTALTQIAVRKSNKKHKFWYDKDQLEQIENMVKDVSENAEWQLETKGNKPVSFTVVDTLNNRVVFTGYFL